jgi:uncharacterized protein (DUF302 family)
MQNNNGVTSIESSQDLAATANAFMSAAKNAGLTIFGQRNLAEVASTEGSPKQGAVLILFGNPKIMGQLIAANQLARLDLPMRALIWQRPDGKATLSYNDPRWLMNRYGLADQFGKLSETMTSVLSKLANAACGQQEKH